MIAIHQQKGIELFDTLQAVLKKHLNLPVYRAPSFTVTNEALDPLRNQYNASAIIQNIKTNGKSKWDLVIVDVDIYALGMNFIFGQADPIKKTAIVSIYRLTGARLNERLAKEVVHEILHLLGLSHCADPECIMHFYNTIDDTDRKKCSICNICRRNLEAL